eukprot:TRINITY_DN51338_c0_g1_i2.p1 TRINITY_DN51338_c0_g1~~TRINITY_DN51338_c0_g1_i2.p1  ORF type:complete len:251 (-),score=24.84 TRINITY_DN51338_c0_g1_i2:381-1133(-)
MSGGYNNAAHAPLSSVPGLDADSRLPVFMVNLDLPPAQRWSAVAEAYAPMLQRIAQWQLQMAEAASASSSKGSRGARGKKRGSGGTGRVKLTTTEKNMTQFAAAEASRLLEQMRAAGGAVAEFSEELAGIASAAGVPLHTLAMLNLQYESCCACTAIVVPSESGGVALGRTLDWELPELKALNIDVHVMSGGKLLYTATTWAGYTGILTAQRPERYAMAINFREATDDDSVAAPSHATRHRAQHRLRCLC